jgi:hypothetical protein
MNPYRKNPWMARLLWTVVVAVIVVAACYIFLKLLLGSSAPMSLTPLQTGTSTSFDDGSADFNATSSASMDASSSSSTAIDTSDWQTFTSYELGFSIQYPPDLTIDTSDPSAFKAAFPRTTYFSTVYADDVSLDVNVNATCTPIIAGSTVVPTQNVTIGGVDFTKDETSDIGAGNIYDTVLYDALNNGVCYQITVVDHHANGAGLYAGDDQTQIASLTAARDSEYSHVSDIVMAMISSFNFVSTPAGENEADYSASAAANGGSGSTGTAGASGAAGSSATPPSTTSIFISTVSPTTLSVGDKLTIIGQGFSGHDTLVQISNGSVQGVLWGGMPMSDTAISATIPAQVCTVYVGASGATCPSYLILNPGTYTVDVSNQNGTTDTSYISIQ